MVTGFGIGALVSGLLTFLIKIFFVLFIIGLVGGLIVVAKNYVFTPEDIEAFKAPFKRKETVQQIQQEN